MDLRRIHLPRGKGRTGFLAAITASLVIAASTVLVQARNPEPLAPASAVAVPASALPEPVQQVMSQISSGGPFRYEKDGTVFFNREGLLPRQKRGFYREYTVPTPGVSHRGARRIVCGGEQPRAPEACYYTEDHYASFRRIAQ